MAIVTISRGCYSHGKEIAETVAKRLDYELVSREILLEASNFFDASEDALSKSINDAPTMLERLTHEKEKYLAYIQASLLEHVKNDNVVYHGHAGHLLLPEISHVLKVRVNAGTEDRIKLLQNTQHIPRYEAEDYIKAEDENRMNWTHYLYHMDINDPKLYDIVIHIDKLGIDDACDIICAAAMMDTHKSTPASTKAICDLALGSHVRAALWTTCDAKVRSNDGLVHVETKCKKIRKTAFSSSTTRKQFKENLTEGLAKEISEIVNKIPGVKGVTCNIKPPSFH